jgi:hypothetical protein
MVIIHIIGVVTRNRFDDTGLTLQCGKCFCSAKCLEWLWVSPSFLLILYWGYFPRRKQPGCEVDH